jgi:hypothetical protein
VTRITRRVPGTRAPVLVDERIRHVIPTETLARAGSSRLSHRVAPTIVFT